MMATPAVKAILIDLSGTLHVGNQVITQSIQAVAKLRSSRLSIHFITNTTKESKATLLHRLNGIGFDIQPEEVTTSLSAAKRFVDEQSLNPLLLLSRDAMTEFQVNNADPVPPYNAVVVGLAPEKFDYAHLNEAFRLVLDAAPLVAIHKARYYKSDDGNLSLGPGGFVSALEYAAGCSPAIIGKPSAHFYRIVLDHLGCGDPREAVMIGDDVQDDIHGAQQLGMRGILVATGKYKHGDEETISPPPYRTCADFAEAVDCILQD